MNCSTPGFPVLCYLPVFAQTHVHWVSDAIWPSHPLSSPSPPALNLSQLQSFFFQMSQLFPSGTQSIEASASVFPMCSQGWFPLGCTGLTTLQSKGLSRVFSSTIVQKHQFFSTQLSFFFFFKFSFLFYFFYNFKIFNSYMRSQTWTPLPPPSP